VEAPDAGGAALMASPRARKTPWPHGLPTVACETCQGSGLSQSKLTRQIEGRATTILGTWIACGTCAGRGRRIVDDPSTYRCKHDRLRRDCPVCRG
jgi:DnaJ-class molecular chaperone